MKAKTIFVLAIAATIIYMSGCKKIENGFLSDYMRYINATAVISRGATSSTSSAVNPDGSTTPITYTYSNLRDSTGKAVPDSFFLKYPIVTWKSGMGYVWATDTTEAIINNKRDTTSLQPISFNTKTGAWSSNAASLYLPLGNYPFDMTASNAWGTKSFKNFGTLTIQDLDISNCWTYSSSNNSITHYAISPYTASTYTKPANTAPTISIVRSSPTGNTLHIIIVDKNGVAFDPNANEIRYYSKTSSTYPSFEYYAKIHAPTYENKQYNINYYINPFPYQYNKMWFYLLYSYSGDNSTIPAGYMYAIWGMQWQITQPGTYSITVQFTNLTHK